MFRIFIKTIRRVEFNKCSHDYCYFNCILFVHLLCYHCCSYLSERLDKTKWKNLDTRKMIYFVRSFFFLFSSTDKFMINLWSICKVTKHNLREKDDEIRSVRGHSRYTFDWKHFVYFSESHHTSHFALLQTFNTNISIWKRRSEKSENNAIHFIELTCCSTSTLLFWGSCF